jgi:hypothetical protein
MYGVLLYSDFATRCQFPKRMSTHDLAVYIAFAARSRTYLSISLSFSTLKSSSQPTSIKICMPPSNSSNDCDAGEELCAPRRGVKLNMIARAIQCDLGDSKSPCAWCWHAD